MVSGSSFFPYAPFSWRKVIPAEVVMSVNRATGTGAAGIAAATGAANRVICVSIAAFRGFSNP